MEGCIDTDGALDGRKDGEVDGGTTTESEPPHTQHASDTSLPAYMYSLPPRRVHHPVLVPRTEQLRPAKGWAGDVPPAIHPGSSTHADGALLKDGLELGNWLGEVDKDGCELGTLLGFIDKDG